MPSESAPMRDPGPTTAGRPARLHVVGPRDRVDDRLREGLAGCWAATANAGGAVGFPWPPVSQEQATAAVDALVANVHAHRTYLVVAHDRAGIAGWVSLDLNDEPLVAHWATVRRLQTHPRARGRGIGGDLMRELARLARDDLGLAQVHLAVRGGMGLEAFYGRLGWTDVGRWPRALRFSATDHRDEVHMVLRLQ